LHLYPTVRAVFLILLTLPLNWPLLPFVPRLSHLLPFHFHPSIPSFILSNSLPLQQKTGESEENGTSISDQTPPSSSSPRPTSIASHPVFVWLRIPFSLSKI
jgi:hypothetical protein